MGNEISDKDIQAGEEKIQAIKIKRKNLMKELQEKQFLKGQTLAVGESFLALTQSQTEESIFTAISGMIASVATGGAKHVVLIISGQLKALSTRTKTSGMVMQEFRGYPLITNQGFAMIYFHFYMEKLIIKKGNNTHQQTIVMNVLKIIKPPIPLTKYDLGAYISASALDQKEREPVMKEIWEKVILTSMDPVQIQNQAIRQLQLQKLRLIQEGNIQGASIIQENLEVRKQVKQLLKAKKFAEAKEIKVMFGLK